MVSEGAQNSADTGPIEAMRPSVAMLSAAHGYQDSITVKHEDRTAKLAVAIGVRLGLGPSRTEVLRLAAIVHDIGKIGVLADIINKPGSLSASEYTIVKTHCAIGHDILQHLRAPCPVAEIVLQHHERLDGSGYPRAMSGENILLEARILAVADVFDAMTSNRSYRTGLPADFVLGELQTMVGRLLDADAVDACRHCILSGSIVGPTVDTVIVSQSVG